MLYGYYPDLKATMAETLLPKAISTDHALRPWGRDAWGEHTPRPDDVGAAAEEEAKVTSSPFNPNPNPDPNH